jgi:putative membrane protein
MPVKRALLAAAACSATLWAHTGEPIAPHDLWSAWSFDPGVVIPLLLSAWLFSRSPGIERWRAACFWAGWLSLVFALVSPLHPMGEALFSAHMAQHEILMAIAAPLLVLSRPLVPFLWGLPFRWRRAAGRWAKTRLVRRAWHVITEPLTAWSLHAVAILVWHAPALFQATLTSDLAHTAQHASFLLSALLFWWALIYSRHATGGYGAAVIYTFTTAVYTGFLGALLALSRTVWYPAYGGAGRSWGLTPLEDQQLGGLIMWVPAGLIYTVAALWFFAAWMRRSEMRVKSAVFGCVLAVAVFALPSCDRNREVVKQQAATMTGGDPDKGKAAISYYGCGSCHEIIGITNANGLVGPPLAGVARRMYIAGVLENTPDNLVRWIENPKAVDEKTAMPYLGVKNSDARDIAGYLYSLK